MLSYQRPQTLKEALTLLSNSPPNARPFAGGTDLLVRCDKGLMERPEVIVDLKKIDALHGITRENGTVCIGALATMTEIASDPALKKAAPALTEAAGRVACPQIRNRATVGGNLSNASPAADLAIPLIVFDAVLEIARLGNDGVETRELPITDFFKGPGATALAPEELLTQIRFAPQPQDGYSAWNKFGTRPAMEIAVCSVGVALTLDKDTVSHARIGYGSVAPVPLRGEGGEGCLVGETLCKEVIDRCVAAAREEISPITDVRASDGYRREVTGVMLRRLLEGGKGA
ncbi:MAG: FAD binding domain-containing protein [Planctomycetota bacterium]|jgi:CO/xanthine dehydrogenase FAD-binding subunit